MLRSDQPHTLYFKGPDFVPELVVLNSEEIDGKARLSPSEVCVKPRYVQVKRELKMEIDPSVSSGRRRGARKHDRRRAQAGFPPGIALKPATRAPDGALGDDGSRAADQSSETAGDSRSSGSAAGR